MSPPGPHLPPLVQAVAYHRDPLGVLRRARARYGPVFALRVTKPVTFVADPAAIDPLVTTTRAGAARRVILPLASERSLFGSDGDEHRGERARLEPWFEDIDRDAIAAIAEEHIAHWPRGTPFRLLERMRALASDVFARVILKVTDPPAYVRAVHRMLNTPGNPPLPVPASADPAFRKRAQPLIELLEREGHDADRLLVVCAAAQEPPGIALTNVAYEIARGTHTSIEDTLRRRPSASAALRELTEPFSIDGHTLPSGTTVALPTLLLPQLSPFGGGARRCVGEPLARAQLETVIPLLPKLKAVWPRPERMVVRGTVLVPHRSALVELH